MKKESNDEYFNLSSFEDIRKIHGLKDEESFRSYLELVFKNFCSYDRDYNLGMSKKQFIIFIKLPVFLSEKLFKVFDDDKDGYLSLDELTKHLSILYFGEYDQIVKEVFRIYDFNNDGLLEKDDVKLVMEFLPYSLDSSLDKLFSHEKELNNIQARIDGLFQTSNQLDVGGFLQALKQNGKAFLVFFLLSFIYLKSPITEESIRLVKGRNSLFSSAGNGSLASIHINEGDKNSNKLSMSTNFNQFSSKNSLECKKSFGSGLMSEPKNHATPMKKVSHSGAQFNGTSSLLKLVEGKSNSYQIPKKTKYSNNVTASASSEQVGDEYTDNSSSAGGKLEEKNQVKTFEKSIEDRKTSSFKKSNFHSTKSQTSSKMSYYDVDLEMSRELHNTQSSEDEPQEEKIKLQEYFYIEIENSKNENKLKKYWLVLIGKILFVYYDHSMLETNNVIPLAGSIIKENGSSMANSTFKYYSFSILLSNGITHSFYAKDKNIVKNWVNSLRESIGYRNFFDYYKLCEEIGKGARSVVKLGINKITEEKVAVKILDKSSNSVESIINELDIVSICRHPKIVSIKDTFENSEYTFLVFELLKFGSLENYLSKTNLSEEDVYNILVQLVEVLKFVHNAGVVHRDLKAENIAIEVKGRNSLLIKLTDFGFSKILGKTEKLNDYCGTLYYMAPEIIENKLYDYSVDVWSLGVLVYFMCSHEYPFSEHNRDSFIPINKHEIKNQILNKEVSFKSKAWSNYDPSIQKVILACLERDPLKRTTLDGLCTLSWMTMMRNKVSK